MTSNGSDPIADEIQLPAFVEGIPVARPIAFEYASPPPPVSEFLLLNESPRSAWADIGWLVLFVIAFEFLTAGLVHLVTGFAFGAGASSSETEASEVRQAMLLPTIAMRALGAIVILAILARRRGQTARSVGLTWAGMPLNIAIGLAALVVVYVLIFVVMALLWFFWPDVVREMNENARRIMELVPKLRPAEFVPLTAMIGVYEELVFRGFLMTRLRRGTGSWAVAVVLSTVIFTSLHAFDQTRSALVVVAILSLVFSLATIWRRSIIPAIIAHALFDLSQLLLLYVQAGDSWT
jgi:membrane protease YdiL (CAAX protease family)